MDDDDAVMLSVLVDESDPYNLESETFDAAAALAHPERVRLLEAVGPLDYTDKFRPLLPKSDPNYRPPPKKDPTVPRQKEPSRAVRQVQKRKQAASEMLRAGPTSSAALNHLMAPLRLGRFQDLYAAVEAGGRVSFFLTNAAGPLAPAVARGEGQLVAFDRQANLILRGYRQWAEGAAPGAAPDREADQMFVRGKFVRSIFRVPPVTQGKQ